MPAQIFASTHKELHAGKSYACKHCGKEFGDRSNCRRHEGKTCQNRGRRYVPALYRCPACPAEGSRKDNVKRHIRTCRQAIESGQGLAEPIRVSAEEQQNGLEVVGRAPQTQPQAVVEQEVAQPMPAGLFEANTGFHSPAGSVGPWWSAVNVVGEVADWPVDNFVFGVPQPTNQFAFGTYPPVDNVVGEAYPPVGNVVGDAYPPVGNVVGEAYPPVDSVVGEAYPPVGNVVGDAYPLVGNVVGDAYPPVDSVVGDAYLPVGNVVGDAYPPVDNVVGEAYLPVGNVVNEPQEVVMDAAAEQARYEAFFAAIVRIPPN